MPRPQQALLCASPACPPHRGKHTAECLATDDKCPGCLPRLAGDGVRLCPLCTRLIGEDARTLAARDRDLEVVLAGGGGVGGEHVSHGGRDPNVKLNPAAVAARSAVRRQLVALVRLICEERGVHLPTFTAVPARPEGFVGPLPLRRFVDARLGTQAGFVGKHALWLAAHPGAGEHAQVLRSLVRSTWGVAFPAGVRLFPVRVPGGSGVAVCPGSVRVRVAFAVTRRGLVSEVFGLAPCEGLLWTVIRPGDDRLPAAVLCNQRDEHVWPSSSWLRRLAPLLLAQARRVQVAAAAGEAATGVAA